MPNEDNIKENIKRLDDMIRCFSAEIKQEIRDVKACLLTKLNDISGELERLKLKNDELEKKCYKLEKQVRKNNIVIFGLNSEQTNSPKAVLDSLNALLDLDLALADVSDIYTLGKSLKNNPVKVEFVSYIRKQSVFRKLSKLKNTKVFIAHDQTKEEIAETKKLKQHLIQAKSRNYNAKIQRGKLIVNGEVYKAKELIDLDLSVEAKEESSRVHAVGKSNSAPSMPSAQNAVVTQDEELVEGNTQNGASERKEEMSANIPKAAKVIKSVGGNDKTVTVKSSERVITRQQRGRQGTPTGRVVKSGTS